MNDDQLLEIIDTFNNEAFSTYDFVLRIQKHYSNEWQALVDEYGAGGKGSGKHYSANSKVARYLDNLTNKNLLIKLDYRSAPENWGSPKIRYWSSENLYPDEIKNLGAITEGARTRITVNRYERNSKVRQRCIEEHGVTCFVCQFDFEKVYGEHGAGFIHVHHIIPLNEIGKEYELDPENDLIPLCPNCHAMIHRKNPALSIKALKKLIKANNH